MNLPFLFLCIALTIKVVQPFDRLNLNQTSSDEDEENEQNSLLRRRLLGRHISNSQNQQTSQSKTQKKQKIPIISLTESISPSRDKSSKSSRNSTSKSLKDSSSKLKSPIGTEIPLFTPTKKKSSLSPQISLSSPHKRKSPQNNPQISPKKVKPPKIENSVSRRFISLVSPRKIRTRSQSRRHERTQSTPPRSHSNANILEENPLEGTSRSTSYPSILPKKKKPKVAEADSTTSDVPLFPNERVANTIRRETSNILNAPLMNLDAMRRYQQHLLDFRRLQNMSEIVNDSFISIDSLDPLNDYHRQNQQNEDDHEFNRTRNFRFSYELDGTFNVTPSTNNSGSSHNNPDDNDDNSSNTRNRRSNERPLSRSSDQNMNSRENQDSHSGQRFEDSNPYQMETSRPPDPADGSESTICYDNLADLLNKDLYIERPVWHGYSFGTGAYNREELNIVEVVAEKSFSLDRQIIEWKSLNHHAIGRGDHGLTLITSYSDGIHIDNKNFDPPVSALDMFQWWDMKSHTMNTGLLTIQSSSINWHHLNNENKLTQLWSWALNFPIVHASIYNLDGNWKVAVTHEQNGIYKRAISIYGLDLWENWWFEEKLRGYSEPIIINNGRLIAVLLEDAETIMIYKYDYSLRRYSNFKNFTSPGVENIEAFIVGSHSFLAIGGDQPGIYEIKASKFEEKDVIHYKLQHVENWLPVTLGYYRNDAIVLFQHKLDHYTHSSSILEALKWDGKDFHLLEHSPCKSHDEEMHGFSCILDAEGEKGIKGAASFKTLDDKVNILTASEEYTPIMFEIKTELVEIPDPIDQRLEQILAHKKYLEDKFLEQQRILKEADKIASYSLDHNEDVVFADGWNIKEIVAPSVHVDGTLMGTLSENGYVDVAGQDWRNIDSTMEITHMFDQIKTDHDRIKNMVNKLKDGTMKKDGLPNKFKDITVSGNIIVHGNVKVKNAHLDVLNGLNVDSVLENSVKKNRDGNLVISGKVVVDNLNADDINVERINGIDISNEDKSNAEPIVVEGDLEIFNHVHVLKDVTLGEHGTVNNIDFKTDIYSIENSGRSDNYESYPLNFDSIIVRDNLIVHNTVNGYDFTKKGFEKLFEESRQYDQSLLKDDLVLETVTVNNLNFDLINGRSWKDFIRRIVMKDEDVTLESLKVDGSIKVEEDLVINALNNLAYPRDYFLLNDNTSAVFTAPKTFENVLHVDEIDCEGEINGISPEDIVTLSTKQRLNNFTFFDLTVTENLNVQGNITGKELDEFLSNPHLTDVNEIKSNVIFKRLKVNGTVIVENKINGSNWNDLFKGVMMKTNQPLTVDSLKSFEGLVRVENDLNIRSGFLNNRRVTDFFTIDTEQILTGDTLMGDIGFEELEVDGMFDRVNVTHLNSEVVTLDGDDQNLASDMVFEDDVDYSDYPDEMDIESRTFSLGISDLIVNKYCNDWAVPDDVLFYNQESLEFSTPKFKNLYVDHLIIEGNLITDKPISGINMYEFDRIRLSKSQSKNIIAPYTVNNCTIDGVDFVTFNGLQKYDIVNFKNKMDNIEDELKNGGINIGTLHVKGNFNVTKINEIDLRFVADNAIWLKENNFVSAHLKFMNKIYVKSLYLNKNAHGVNFERHMNNLVLAYKNPIIITGKKTYVNGLNVKGNLSTDFINSIQVDNIFTTHTSQDLKGNLQIIGKLSVAKNLHINGFINEISMKEVANSFEYLKNNKYYLKGNFFLENGAYIDDLIIDGVLNDVYSMKDIIESTANPTDEKYFSNNVIFTKPVLFKNNLNIISTYNNIYFQKLLDDIVMKNSNAVIDSSIVFVAPVIIKKNLNVENNMLCDFIQYCSLKEWIYNAIYLNQTSRISGIKSFEELIINGNLKAKYLNNILINDFITLNTEQILTKGLNFANVNVELDILVDETVNSKNIIDEFDNILMMKGNQVLESPIFFHSNVDVTTDAFINLVNGINIDNVFNLDTDQFLKGKYSFHGKSSFQNNFNVSNLISNIDFNLWFKNAIFSNDYGNNIIKGKWHVSGYTKFHNEIIGPTSINGLKIYDFENYLIQRNQTIASNENNFAAKYKYYNDYLESTKSISEKRIYLFKYLEETQSLSSSDLTSVHYFAYKENNYILTHSKWECKSFLWKWKAKKLQFEKINHVNMGCPIKAHSLEINGFLILIIINDIECECDSTGTTIWNFDGNTFQLIKTLDPVNSISIPPNNTGIFYTMNEETIDYYTIFLKNGNFEIEKIMLYPKPSGKSKFLITNYQKFGTFVSDGNKLYEYSISDRSSENGKILQSKNKLLAEADEIIEFVVGKNKKLTAVLRTSGINNRTKGFIKLYQNAFSGIEFQEIYATKPSSLTILQLDNLQTILLFIEDKTTIPIYLYHGIEGFKLLYNLNIPTNKIMNMKLKTHENNSINGLILCNDDVVSIIKVVMTS